MQNTSSNLQLPTLQWLNSEQFLGDEHWWNIYIDSFPTTEQDTQQQLLNALTLHNAKIACFKLSNKTVAIAVLYFFRSMPFAFLHFFAVAKGFRNKGWGSRLLESLIIASEDWLLQKNTSSLGVVWEVEDPSYALDQEQKHLYERRIKFYKKSGGILFQHRFIQPAIDGKTLVPMCLMFRTTVDHAIILQQELELIKAIYFEKYQAINNISHDTILQLMQQC